MKMDFDGGKYTVIFDEAKGTLGVLRDGEPWQRDLAGDKLVLAMLTRALELQQEQLRLRLRNAELLVALQVLELTVRADPRHVPELPQHYRHAVDQAQAVIDSAVKQPCRSPYCECEQGQCTHPGCYDARHEPLACSEQALARVPPVVDPEPVAWRSIGGSIWGHKTREDDIPLYTVRSSAKS